MKNSVLFICLGNICRSPTAEAVFRAQVEEAGLSDKITIDSAGTGEWHIGKPPDHRAQTAGLERGFDLSALRARLVTRDDFSRYQWIIAMDENNLRDLQQLSPSQHQNKIRLLLDFSSQSSENKNVPDPYYGTMKDFHHVVDLVKEACEGLLVQIKKELG